MCTSIMLLLQLKIFKIEKVESKTDVEGEEGGGVLSFYVFLSCNLLIYLLKVSGCVL